MHITPLTGTSIIIERGGGGGGQCKTTFGNFSNLKVDNDIEKLLSKECISLFWRNFDFFAGFLFTYGLVLTLRMCFL